MTRINFAAAVVISLLLVFVATLFFVQNGGLQSDRAEAMRRYAVPSSRFAEIDGITFHYRDEGSGPPLVLLHGSRASLHQWDGWAAELKPDYRIIRVDALGHGLTSTGARRDYAPQRGVELMRLFADELGLRSFYLGGTSSGSSMAVRFAATHPDRVLKLALSTTPLKLSTRVEMPVVRRVVFWAHQHVLQSTATSLYWRHFLEGIYADSGRVADTVVERYRILNSFPGRDDEQRHLISTWYENGGPDRDYELAGRVTAPVLIQWGGAGPVLPPRLQCTIAEAFSATTVSVITYPNLGHKLVMEDPSLTARDARRFLEGESLGSTCAQEPLPASATRQ